MRARGHAEHTGGGAERERAAIGKRAPLRRHHGRGCQRPECAGSLAGDEGAVLRAVATRVPPGPEMLVAAELAHVDRTRASPVLLEHDIGDETGRERERRHDQQDRTPRNGEQAVRPDQLDDGRDEGRQRDERDHPGDGIARAQDGRIIGTPEPAMAGIEEQRGEMQIEPRPDPEDHAGDSRDGKRDDQAGSVHASIPARRPAEPLLRPRRLVPAGLRVLAHRRQPVPALVAAREQGAERNHAGDASGAFAPIGCGRHGETRYWHVVLETTPLRRHPWRQISYRICGGREASSKRAAPWRKTGTQKPAFQPAIAQ